MSFTYSDLENDLKGNLRNSWGSITNTKTLINSSIRRELSSFDYSSTKRATKTERSLHDDIYRYALPSDMKKEALIDIVKYKNYTQGSNVNPRKVNIRVFNSNFGSDTLAFDYSDGLSWLKANLSNANSSVPINTMESLTDNGTWTASDNGENISLNDTNYVSGSYSIEVDLASGGTTLAIENSTLTAVDLDNVTKLFYWVYLPTTSNITALGLLYGSSASAYNTTTTTTPFNVDSLQQGWNLIGFDTGTATGSPDMENVDYVKPYIAFSSTPSTRTGFIFDNITASKGEPYEINYYSKYPWRNSAGTWIENSTVVADTLNAQSEEYAVLLARVSWDLAKAVPMSDSDLIIFEKDYYTAKKEYKHKYPSSRKKLRLNW